MDKNLKELGRQIKKERLAKNLTSTKFANEINVSQSYISDLENGKKKNPRIEILERIAIFLGDSDESKVKFLYANFLELAGYTNERNRIIHGVYNPTNNNDFDNVLTLDEFINQLTQEENKPIQQNEFILNYKKTNDDVISVRSTIKNDSLLFDLDTILRNEFKTVTHKKNGITSYGNTPLYYCGKEIRHNDRIKIMKILDAVFDIDRKNINNS